MTAPASLEGCPLQRARTPGEDDKGGSTRFLWRVGVTLPRQRKGFQAATVDLVGAHESRECV